MISHQIHGTFNSTNHLSKHNSGIILGVALANERGRYIVMSFLIGWAHTQNDPCNDLSMHPHAHISITLMPQQNGCHFADNIFKCIFYSENYNILIQISPIWV